MSGVRVKRNGDRLAAREHTNMKLKTFSFPIITCQTS